MSLPFLVFFKTRTKNEENDNQLIITMMFSTIKMTILETLFTSNALTNRTLNCATIN